MASRIRYLLRRLSDVPRVLVSPLGLVALSATLTGLVALMVDDAVSAWLAAASLMLWLMTILIIGDRLRIAWKQLRRRPPPTVITQASKPAGAPRSDGPSLRERRLEAAQRVLAQVAPLSNGADAEDDAASAPATGKGSLVSIVIPCFNDGRYILSTLESVRDQTHENWECIVVDDASTDDSLKVAWEFAETDDRIRVVRHTRNCGLSAARNTGLRLAHGTLITFLDSDDFLTEDSIEDRLQHLIPHVRDLTVAGIYCGAVLAPEDALPIDYRGGEKWSGSSVDFVTSGHHCPFNVHAALVRTSVLRGAGGFDESMEYGAEDWDLWYRVMRNGFRFEPSGLRSAIYRQKPSSMRQRHALEHFAEAERLVSSSQKSADDFEAFSVDALPMLRAKSDYEQSISLAHRAIQSAATSLLSGDEEGAIEMLTAIEPIHPSVLAWDVRTERSILDGFRRYLGLGIAEMVPLQRQLAPIADHAARLIADHVRTEQTEINLGGNNFDILLVPQTSYQLRQMLAAVGETELHVGVVDSSSVAGDQGVADLLEREPLASIAVMSYNETLLEPFRSAVVVLSYPWDAAIDELALHFRDTGASIVSLGTDLDGTLRIDDAPPSRVSVREIPGSILAEACRANTTEFLVREFDEDSGPRFDTTLLAYRDAADAWTIEEYPERVFDASELSRFKGIHTGERVVIIGNGPSLNDLDLSLLRGTHTIGVNGIFYADDQLPEPLSYYVVEDTMVVRDNLERIKTYEAGHRFFPSIYREMIGESDNSTFFMMNRGFYASTSPGFCVPRFSTDPSQRVYAGQSVTIMNLQLAYYMGFTEVILIGMDFSYTVPESSQIDGAHITSMEDDPNHFHPDYFGKGKVWKDPKLDRVLANYALAKQMYEADGRRIINATPGGNLHLFDRVPFDELFGQ